MRYLRCAAAAAVIGSVLPVAAANVTILGSTRTVSTSYYNSQTGASSSYPISSNLAVGSWSRSSGDLASHHSVVTETFIYSALRGNWRTTPLESPYYEQEIGAASLATRFEVSGSSTAVVMDNGLMFARLVRESPDPRTWEFALMQRTEVLGLTPGVYLYFADNITDGGGAGTLYIPGAGSYLLLGAGLLPLLARPRRIADCA